MPVIGSPACSGSLLLDLSFFSEVSPAAPDVEAEAPKLATPPTYSGRMSISWSGRMIVRWTTRKLVLPADSAGPPAPGMVTVSVKVVSSSMGKFRFRRGSRYQRRAGSAPAASSAESAPVCLDSPVWAASKPGGPGTVGEQGVPACGRSAPVTARARRHAPTGPARAPGAGQALTFSGAGSD